MKKYAILLLLFSISFTSYCQQINPSPSLAKQDYLKKSKNQRTTGFIFLAGGLVLSSTGVLMAVSNNSGLFDPNDSGLKYSWTLVDILGYGGLVIAATSIPFFVASSKNKKKAFGLSLKKDLFPGIHEKRSFYHSVPSISVSMAL